jgi:hypothetical protein
MTGRNESREIIEAMVRARNARREYLDRMVMEIRNRERNGERDVAGDADDINEPLDDESNSDIDAIDNNNVEEVDRNDSIGNQMKSKSKSDEKRSSRWDAIAMTSPNIQNISRNMGEIGVDCHHNDDQKSSEKTC